MCLFIKIYTAEGYDQNNKHQSREEQGRSGWGMSVWENSCVCVCYEKKTWKRRKSKFTLELRIGVVWLSHTQTSVNIHTHTHTHTHAHCWTNVSPKLQVNSFNPAPAVKNKVSPLQLHFSLTIIEWALSSDFIEFFFTDVYCLYVLYCCAIFHCTPSKVQYHKKTGEINAVVCRETPSFLLCCFDNIYCYRWFAMATQHQLLERLHSNLIKTKTSWQPRSLFLSIHL